MHVRETAQWRLFMVRLHYPENKKTFQKPLERADRLRELRLPPHTLIQSAFHVAEPMKKAMHEYNKLQEQHPDIFEPRKRKGQDDVPMASKVEESDFAPEEPSWPNICQMSHEEIDEWKFDPDPEQESIQWTCEDVYNTDDYYHSEPEEGKEPTGLDLFHRGLANAANGLNRLGMLEEANKRVKKFEKASQRS